RAPIQRARAHGRCQSADRGRPRSSRLGLGGLALPGDRGESRRVGCHRRLADPQRAAEHLERRLMGERPPWRRGRYRTLDSRWDGGGRGRHGGSRAQARSSPHQRPRHRGDPARGRRVPARARCRARTRRAYSYGVNGTRRWHAEQAWLGHRGENVLIEVEDGLIKAIAEGVPAPHDAIALKGWTIPGLANVHSHAFQRLLPGEVESGGGDFWKWRARMYGFAEWDPADYFNHARLVFREMLEAGITAVGEFHYLHSHG